MQGSANLNVMVKAARKAGRSLVKDFREVENLQVSVKGAGDFVSRADIAAETLIRDDLLGARPNYGWLGEESAPIEGKDPTRRWIVDPLDGTTNFLHGMPHWCVSIALEHKGEVVSAVIFDAAKDEMFIAEKGGGAWMNERRLRVSGRRTLIESVLATSIPHSGAPGLPRALAEIARIAPAVAAVRQMGSAALDLAWVAAGRFDGCWDRGLKPWDLAAGLLICREAGGFVEPLREGRSILEDGGVLAANTALFEGFAALARG